MTKTPTTKMRFFTPSAVKAYEAMLDEVRAENTHLSGAALDAKLCAARDEYCRQRPNNLEQNR